MSEPTESTVIIEPAAERWGPLVRVGGALDAARSMRAELGLPLSGPVLMTGHQAIFWHPGILAKYLAVERAAAALGAHAALVVVDHDTDDPWAVRYPAKDASGRLRARVFDVRGPRRDATGGAPGGAGGEVSVCRRGAATPSAEVPADAATGGVRDGLARICAALASNAGAVNAARQVVGALSDLMRPLCAPAPAVFSSELNRTALFGAMLAEMERDPRACVLAYNEAVRHAPGSGLRALQADEVNERYELPLWSVGADGARQRVYAESLGATPRESLMPRALMMTALLRLGACDLFVHGTGGGLYERANDAWMQAWFGAGAPMAGVAVVTATLRLRLADSEPPSAADVARARWRAHRARHDPAMLGDEQAARRRRELVAAVKGARRAGNEPREAFSALHAYLAERRAATGAALRALEHEADDIAARALDAAVSGERTWAFPMYSREAMDGLKAEIGLRFGGVR